MRRQPALERKGMRERMTMASKMLLAVLLAGVAAPVAAQRPLDVEQRVNRLEKQMNAVQRKVFPGGGNREYFEPEITPAAPPPPAAGLATSNPVADLTARVSSLEQALAKVTGQVETNSYKLRQLEDAVARLRADAAPPPIAGAPNASGSSTLELGPAPQQGGSSHPTPPFGPPPGTRDQNKTPAAPPPAPATGDPGEDAYLAGYRLWEAKKYPEAEAALRAVVAKYPNHRRASYAQNLLGRSLLDDNQPAKAAEAFYANYQKMPRGERAPDSLYFLGQSLMALKPPKPADACKVYGELLDVYGEKINAALKAKVTKGQADAKCAK